MKILFASWVGLVPIQYIGDKCKQLVIGGVYTEWRVIPVYNHHICQLYVAKIETLRTNASNWRSVHRVEGHHNTSSLQPLALGNPGSLRQLIFVNSLLQTSMYWGRTQAIGGRHTYIEEGHQNTPSS